MTKIRSKVDSASLVTNTPGCSATPAISYYKPREVTAVRLVSIRGLINSRTAFVSVIVILTILLNLGDLAKNTSPDFGAYWVNGWFISQGMVPYEDFFEHKTPLFSVAIAGWMKLFGPEFLSSWLFKLSTIFALTSTSYFVARKLDLARPVAKIATVIVAFYTASHVLELNDNGLIVVFTSIFEMLAIATGYAAAKQRDGRRFGLAAGAFLALAMAARQTAVVLLPFTLIAALVIGYRKNKQLDTLGIVWILVGFSAMVLVLLAVYLFDGGNISSIRTQLIDFNLNYLDSTRRNPLDFVNTWFLNLTLPDRVMLTLAFTAAVYLAIRRKLSSIDPDVAIFVVIILLGVVVSLVAQGRHKDYYFKQFVPFAALLVAPYLYGLFSDISAMKITTAVRAFLITTLIVVGLAAPIQREVEVQIWLYRQYIQKSTDQLGGSVSADANFLNTRYPDAELKFAIVGDYHVELAAYTEAEWITVDTIWGPSRSVGGGVRRMSESELKDWVEQVNQTEFVLLIDYGDGRHSYTLQDEFSEIDDSNNHWKEAVLSVTRDMQRIDYPSDKLAIYVKGDTR